MDHCEVQEVLFEIVREASSCDFRGKEIEIVVMVLFLAKDFHEKPRAKCLAIAAK